MGLSKDDLEKRRKFVTASEMPAILGVSPWANAADIFMSKVYGVDQSGNDATEAGTLLEPAVLSWAATQLGTLTGGGWRVHEDGLLAATLDEQTIAGEPVEAKTTGIVGPGDPSHWGADYTDDVPDHVLIQVQFQMLVTGASRAFIPALIGNRGFSMYLVNENRELQGILKATAEQFWSEHVLTGIQPEDVRPNLSTLKRVMRTPGKAIEISDDLAANYFRTSELASMANKEFEAAKAALLASLGDAEIGKWSDGEFTFKTQVRKGYVVEDSSFRVLRSKRAKVKA